MKHSIRELWIQIKAHIGGFIESEFAGDLAIVLAILLVGFGSFGLGRLSAMDIGDDAQISLSNIEFSENPTPIPPGGQFVASRYGSKYYYPWCGGAKSIKDSNLIWFDSEDKARSAGYSPASNCKGLK